MTDALRQRIRLLGSRFDDADARNELMDIINKFLHTKKNGDNKQDVP